MKEPEKIMNLFEALTSSKVFAFPEKGKIELSGERGVYVVYSPFDVVLHVGSTPRGKGGINQRLYNHISGTSSFRKNYLKPKGISLRKGYKFKYIEVGDARTRVLLEVLAAGLLCPKYIGTSERKLDL